MARKQISKKTVIWCVSLLLISGTFYSALKPKSTKVLAHPPNIYKNETKGEIYSPFSLKIQPMERLLLVNFDNDPDDVYLGFEPQYFNDPIQGTGLLVIAWRVDGFVDVYHQPTLNIDPKTFEITGKGLADMVVTPLGDSRFEINDSGVDAYFAFEDKLGRAIEFKVIEGSNRKRKPFGLVAPMGNAVENPTVLPLVMLEDFYFVRRANTQIKILVAGKEHKTENLPVPIDGARMYFVRYSHKPTIAKFNQDYSGVIAPLELVGEGKAKGNDIEYELVENEGQKEIKSMKLIQDGKAVLVEFNPPVPNIVNLKNNINLNGEFVISSGPTVGMISGEYSVDKQNDKVYFNMIPKKGWIPNEKKLPVRLMYRVNSDFKKWPSTYKWEAIIDLNNLAEDQVTMSSKWERIASK